MQADADARREQHRRPRDQPVGGLVGHPAEADVGEGAEGEVDRGDHEDVDLDDQRPAERVGEPVLDTGEDAVGLLVERRPEDDETDDEQRRDREDGLVHPREDEQPFLRHLVVHLALLSGLVGGLVSEGPSSRNRFVSPWRRCGTCIRGRAGVSQEAPGG